MTFLDNLQIKYPIIQAPMAGVTTAEFVAASTNAGILGSLGAGYLSAEATRGAIQDIRKLTDKPFAVNLFVPSEIEMDQELLRQAYLGLQPIGKKLGMPFWKAPLSESCFDEQIDVIIEEGVSICSFTFGLPSEEIVEKLKQYNVFLIGTATSVGEAMMAEQRGMHAIVVQGKEAGGHRGSFIGEELIPLDELLTETVAKVGIPVIAAGGIANKERLNLLLEKGAQAVQLGTALLATEESGAHPLYKKAVLDAKEGCTVLTKAFSGKLARGIRNPFITLMANTPIAPYPIQNDLTKKIRSEAAAQGRPEFMSLWAGESVHETRSGFLQEIIKEFID